MIIDLGHINQRRHPKRDVPGAAWAKRQGVKYAKVMSGICSKIKPTIR